MNRSLHRLQQAIRCTSILVWFVSAPLILLSQAWVDSTCVLTEYQVGDHMFWLNKLPGDPSTDYVLGPNDPATIEFFADSTARMIARVQNIADSTRQWDVEMWLIRGMDYQSWTALGRSTKNGGGTNNQSTWRFYELDSTRSFMYGVPGTHFGGDTILLLHNPPSLNYGFQIGYGANDKNANYGISGWFLFDGDYSGKGDINANMSCSPNPPCFTTIDTAYAQCVTDSTFSVLVTFSGNDSLYLLTDQNGQGPGAVSPGSYLLGPYVSGSMVSLFLDAVNGDSCSAAWDSLTATCEPVNICDVVIDTAFAQCASDTSFEFVVTFSGIGTSFAIDDDQGSPPMIVNQPGTYVFGDYINSVEAFIFVKESNLNSCVDSWGPLTADCTPVATCDLVLDSVYTECQSDSTFGMVVEFSGTGTDFQVYDDQGSAPLTGLSEGTYVFGEYKNGTPVSLTVLDFAVFNCFLITPAMTDSCSIADTTSSLWGNFQASAAGDEVYLTWNSLREIDVETYAIERSDDSLNYEIIRFLPGMGNMDGLRRYEVRDDAAEYGNTYYYRLCMIDHQGRRRFSPVRKVRMNLARVGTIGLMYPQPVQTQSQLPVVAAREGSVLDILVVDPTGKVQARYEEPLQKGSQEITLSWEGLPPGLYFLRAVIDGQEGSAQRVLVWGE